MELYRIIALANEFFIKAAEEKLPWPEMRPEDLKWLDSETIEEIKENEKNEHYKPRGKLHNPPSMIADEKIWDRAKKAVKPYQKKYKNKWPIVFTVYRSMHGRLKKKKKKK